MINSNYICRFESGKINNYLHLVDINQFKKKRVFSVFIAEFDEYSVILDCGCGFGRTGHLLRSMGLARLQPKNVPGYDAG